MAQEPPYLYLTTIGWKSGDPHQIEIWFVTHAGNHYLVSEKRDRAHWVQNIQHHPDVTVRVGQRDAPAIACHGRVVSADETALVADVARLMDAKYDWSDGLIVELAPRNIGA